VTELPGSTSASLLENQACTVTSRNATSAPLTQPGMPPSRAKLG
jgi:hypothetical protein